MIKTNNVSLSYGNFLALDDVSITVKDGSIYGLIGSNGSGKSTLLRALCGVFKCKKGEIEYDGKAVFENPEVKGNIVYISDDSYFFSQSSMYDMAAFYASAYKNFSYERFYELASKFNLDTGRKISTFSKGMTKQAAVVLSLACNTQYILCDETFDGLDPVMRRSVRSIFASEVARRSLTVVIASHNLRELEDICDHVALLHKGKLVLESDVDDCKMSIHKIQAVIPENANLSELNIVKSERHGSLTLLIVRGEREHIESFFNSLNPKFFELVPLTLEEIFITRMQEAGYEVTENL